MTSAELNSNSNWCHYKCEFQCECHYDMGCRVCKKQPVLLLVDQVDLMQDDCKSKLAGSPED